MKKKTLIIDSHPSFGGIARLQKLVPNCLDSSECLSYVSSQKVLRRVGNLLKLYIAARIKLKHCKYVLYMHPYLAKLHSYLYTNIPYGFLVHGYEVFKDNEGKLNDVFRHADTVISNSQYVHRFITRKYDTKQIIQVYYPTVELRSETIQSSQISYEGLRKEYHDTDEKLVLTVGRMSKYERYKGHDEIIEALPSIINSYPNTKFVFIGTGDDEERLKNKVSNKHLDKYLEFKGQVSDTELADLYERADIFLMPSSGEGQGLVYLEAMQFSTPIIALKDSPAGEFVSHNESGQLLNDKTPDQIAHSVSDILADKEKRESFGKEAYRRYVKMDIKDNFCRTLRQVVNSNQIDK